MRRKANKRGGGAASTPPLGTKEVVLDAVQ
jgi:hypothetical protein